MIEESGTMTKRLVSLAALGTAVLCAASALADRPPTPSERAAIEQALRSQGFVRWEEIELDDGMWEVDDARTKDGVKYDLKLDPATLRIVKRERDD
jgi:hypothetical protein